MTKENIYNTLSYLVLVLMIVPILIVAVLHIPRWIINLLYVESSDILKECEKFFFKYNYRAKSYINKNNDEKNYKILHIDPASIVNGD